VSAQAELLVVGSINLDLSLRVERFARPGETVIGNDVVRGGGGKGANQAVAAARLGRRVTMAGAVGDDDPGRALLAALEAEGINVDQVTTMTGVATGLAVIEVDASGENRIVVASGANAAVDADCLEPLASTVAEVPVVLAQLELPRPVVETLATMERRGRLIVNPAPADAALDPSGIDILIPNRGELAAMVGGEDETDIDAVVDQVRSLGGSLEAVVVTMGGDGSVVVDGLRTGDVRIEHIPATPVEVVDTTAAGDAFCGALADALCLGAGLVEAARWASRVAAATVTRRGAQDSLPARSDVIR
jgi:ribokinase